ncbi:MAG: BtpA/SgcQ family protein [Gaiellales bacterium]
MDSRGVIASLFGAPRALIGMIHLDALPGTPAASQSVEALAQAAVADAEIYQNAGFHGLIIENMSDLPYLKRAVGPEVVAAMAAIGCELRRAVHLALGFQILAGANREALAVALACGASFIRAEGFVFAHVADEGMLESDAGELLRYRRAIGANAVHVFADVKKKHAAHALTADVGLAETARAAEFFLADGVIVSGSATGRETDPVEVAAVAEAVTVPTIVGSGVTAGNLGRYPAADAFIVGSSVKRDGLWSDPLDAKCVDEMARAFEALGTE